MQSKTSSKASGRTKKLIAMSLKELCKTNPLRKITIRDIVEHCDINRSTFYYHLLINRTLLTTYIMWKLHSRSGSTFPWRRKVGRADVIFPAAHV